MCEFYFIKGASAKQAEDGLTPPTIRRQSLRNEIKCNNLQMNIISLKATLFLLYLHASRAFHPANHPASSPDRPASRPITQMSAVNENLLNQLSQYQKRDTIPNDHIFFIELGFGELLYPVFC